MADVDIVIGAQDRASQVLAGVGKGVSALSSGMKLLGPVAVGAATAMAGVTAGVVAFNAAAEVVMERAKAIDELAKAAARVGESAGDLQAFQFALGEIAGVDAETARQALAELRKSIGEALQGDQGKIDILAQIGLDPASLSQGGPVEAFARIKDAIGGIENASQRAAVAEKLLGGEARKLMGLLSDQSDAFAQSMQAAEDLGLTISDAGAAGVEAMNDSLGRVSALIEGLVTQFTAELAPAIQIAAEAILDIAGGLDDTGITMRDVVDYTVGFVGLLQDAASILQQIGEAQEYISTLGATGDLSFDVQLGNAERLLVELEAKRQANARAAANRAAERIGEARAQAEAVAEAASKETEAEAAKETAAEKTLAQLEKQLEILRLGSDEYERQQQLATATTDAERERIAALQSEIAAREAMAEKERQAQQDAEQKQSALANAQTGTTAVESRLLTRGPARNKMEELTEKIEKHLSVIKDQGKEMTPYGEVHTLQFVDGNWVS